ncbi:MAG TPA: alpha/beta hydrolase [bacterium]
MLYRNFDRAALDIQYDNRRRVPEHPQHSERWAKACERMKQEIPGEFDVPYGPTPAEKLDVFPAAHPGGPVLVYIHGGYWMSRDKADFSFIAAPFVKAGVSVVVVNYVLAPNAGLDEIVQQNRAAAAWAWRNARMFGGDPDRLFVAGHSAGGHLTVALMETDWPAFGSDLPADLVAGGCAISGIYDLEPIRLCYLNDTLHMDPAVAQRNSPLFHVPKTGADLVLAVGGSESEEFLRQNREMAAAWRAKGHPCLELEMPGKDHFTIIGQFLEPGNGLAQAMLRQMRV